MNKFYTLQKMQAQEDGQKLRHPFRRGLKKLFFLLIVSLGLIRAANAQCVAPYMSFHSPVLIEGTDNQVGAVYLFSEVMPGVDATIKIADLVGGAQLYNIDDSTGLGYYDAFQPYVVAPANVESYIDWEITFKIGGTSTDTSLACFAITGVDVDGNGSSLQEFIEAATPGSYALDPFTILNFSFDGVRSKAISTVANIPNIDTAHLEAMFQMNFQNISTLKYRNGALSAINADMVRQTCIYFKSFFDAYTLLLPVKLQSFSARENSNAVAISWTASNENDLGYYMVQKSSDGSRWRDLQTVSRKAGATNNYFVTDAEQNTAPVYYRLKQIQRTGQPVYSAVLKVNMGSFSNIRIANSTLIKESVNLQCTSAVNEEYHVGIYNVNGSLVKQQSLMVSAGYNTATIAVPAGMVNGLYILVIKNRKGEILQQSKMIKN